MVTENNERDWSFARFSHMLGPLNNGAERQAIQTFIQITNRSVWSGKAFLGSLKRL